MIRDAQQTLTGHHGPAGTLFDQLTKTTTSVVVVDRQLPRREHEAKQVPSAPAPRAVRSADGRGVLFAAAASPVAIDTSRRPYRVPWDRAGRESAAWQRRNPEGHELHLGGMLLCDTCGRDIAVERDRFLRGLDPQRIGDSAGLLSSVCHAVIRARSAAGKLQVSFSSDSARLLFEEISLVRRWNGGGCCATCAQLAEWRTRRANGSVHWLQT